MAGEPAEQKQNIPAPPEIIGIDIGGLVGGKGVAARSHKYGIQPLGLNPRTQLKFTPSLIEINPSFIQILT